MAEERFETLISVAKAKGEPIEEYQIRLSQIKACMDARDPSLLNNPNPSMLKPIY